MAHVYWITGLAGSGKTTIGSALFRLIRKEKPNVVHLDGDQLRSIFGNGKGYSREERFELAMSYARLCKNLAEQDIDVVISTISLFGECHRWNRDNIPGYREIYLRVPMEILIKRDQKKIYSRAMKGETNNVIGVDIPFDEPTTPDCVIDNDGSSSPHLLSQKIITTLGEK